MSKIRFISNTWSPQSENVIFTRSTGTSDQGQIISDICLFGEQRHTHGILNKPESSF